MSFDEDDDRWTDDSPACPHCGVRIRSNDDCGVCAAGDKLVAVQEPSGRFGAEDWYGFRYPPLTEAEKVGIAHETEEREIDDMAIIAKETGSNFKPAPAGVAAAVGCDVVDLGMVKTSYPGRPDQVKHKVRMVWQLADVDDLIGKRPIVSQRYTLSLHEKAALRRDLESWRGRTFTPQELAGFDVEKVIGVPCMLNIVHNVSKGVTYANVSAIMPIPKGMPKPIVEGYTREKDRPKDVPDGAGVEREAGDDEGYGDPSADNEFHASDQDVPF